LPWIGYRFSGCGKTHRLDEFFRSLLIFDLPISAVDEETANAQRTLSELLAFRLVLHFIAARRVFHFRKVLQPFVQI
jgi:hypothetical protein